ncbi:MAG TPA: hypothetical protein VGC06_28290, partial [Actinomycetes bacterium]
MRSVRGAQPGKLATAMLAALALTGCTGAAPHGERVRRAASAPTSTTRPVTGPSLQFAVAAEPIDCQDPSSPALHCVLGGSAVTGRFGKLRIYHEVRLGPPSRDGCAPATLDGSVSGGGWSLPLRGGGRWCGRETTLRYRLGGPRGGRGTISYRRSPLGTATETLRG